jgi:hypothetical protein
MKKVLLQYSFTFNVTSTPVKVQRGAAPRSTVTQDVKVRTKLSEEAP